MPYFYKLKEKTTGRYYVGCRYAKNAKVEDLGKTYLTSSKYVMGKEWGDFEICYIVERDDARSYEARYLKKCFGILGRDKFLCIMINRNIAPGILNTPESLAKANQKRRISNSKSAKKLLEKGEHNFQKYKASNYSHVREHRSKRMIGNSYGSFRKITSELKTKLSEKSKGNTNVRGTKWWFNSLTNEKRRCLECPGEGWVNKCPSTLSDIGRKKISEAASRK